MMAPANNTNDNDSADQEGNFSLIQATWEGLPALILIDAGLNPDREEQGYPWLIKISLRIANPNELGLCDEAESERLNNLEDRLLQGLDRSDYRYVGHITYNGRREILIYVANPEKVLRAIEKQFQVVGESQIEITKVHDPHWQEFRKFLIQ
jgi:Family of unknown function (DUF695)